MCGIAGWAGTVAADAADLRRMCDAVSHRGPDDEGMRIWPGKAALGFRRLSIIDLQTGAQPIENETGTVAVTCNGEIYNFPELRDALCSRGHRFRTASDVEVLVHLYEDRGLEMLQAIEGMFAIALWDANRDRLVLARDRMGVKPLYWAEVPGGVVYASEPVAILACGMVAARPDPMAIVEYLTLQYVPAPRSGFDTIRKLAPGEVLVFENGAATVDCYWSLPEEKDESHLGDDLLLRQLDELIGDATRRRLISDVPLGAFLSGGLDSTLVVGYMADALSQVRTFSIDFPDAAYSEAEAARAVASLYGTDHQELRVEPDIVPVIAAASQAAGEPFADSSAVPTYLLSQLTRQHVKVALSGDGGDEAFGGYWRYLRATRADRVDAARPLARAAVALAGAIVPQTHSSPPGRLALLALPPQERYAAMVSHFQPPAIDRLLQPDFLANAGGSRIGWEELLALPTRPSVNSYARLDTKTYLPGALLTKVDRMSMAHGLEVRSPFLDYRIHEFAASVPARAKLRGQTTKWLLRRLAAHRGVPARIVDRPKKGFSMPIGKWFRGELRGWLTELLIDGRAASRGYFRPGVVERLLGEHLDGTVDHSSRLWNLAMLELWHREWIDG